MDSLGNQLLRVSSRHAVADGLKIRGNLPGEHFNIPGAKHASGGSGVADGLQRRGRVVLPDGAANRETVPRIERREVEPLGKHEEAPPFVAWISAVPLETAVIKPSTLTVAIALFVVV